MSRNFATSLLANAPGVSGTTFAVESGTGGRFVAGVATVGPDGAAWTPATAEVVTIADVTGDSVTVARAAESSAAVSVQAGYRLVQGITAGMYDAITESLAAKLPASAGAVGTTSLAAGAVTTAKIADGAVTAAKVAADVATQAELDALAGMVSAAVSSYSSGLAVVVGQLLTLRGITYRVTAAHTTGALPDMTKMVAFNAEPAIFYPESYGAIGDGTAHPLSEVYGTLAAAQAVYPFATALTDTLDQCGIQAAINAAADSGCGVVQFQAKVYNVNGAFRTTGGGYSLLYLPLLSGSRVCNLELRGAVGPGGWVSSATGASGTSPSATILTTTKTGVTLGVNSEVPCLLGGPSREHLTSFTQLDVKISNLCVQLPTNPTLAGVDLARVLRATVEDVNINTVDAAGPAPTCLWAIGLRMPDPVNYGLTRIGALGVFGYRVALIANTEHLNADDLTFKYNYCGLAINAFGGWHGAYIGKFMSEWTKYHIASWVLSGGVQPPQVSGGRIFLNIDMFDIEDAPTGNTWETVSHVLDNNNMLRGRIQFVRAPAATPTNSIIANGASSVQFIDLAMAGPSVGVIGVKDAAPAADITTSSTTFADVDAANAVVTFVAPSSGKVRVSLSAVMQGASATTYAWNLRDGSGDVAGTKRTVAIGDTTNRRASADILVSGLTAGTSYTWKWGHGLVAGSGTCRVSGSAGGETTASMSVSAA